MAALGINVQPVPYTNSLNLPNPYHHQLAGYLSTQSTSLSHSRLKEGHSHLERGRDRPCSGSRRLPNEGEPEHMSQNSPAPGPPSSDAPQQHSRSLIEGADSSAERHASGTAANPDTHEPASTQAFSWHRSAPVEHPVPTQPRSIGVHAILNPPESAALSSTSRRSSRDGLDLPVSISPSPQQRTSSSPVARLVHPSNQHLQTDRPPLSPGTRPRRIITPVSPAARAASAAGRLNNTLPGKISVSQSPFVLEPSSGVYNIPPGPQLPEANAQSIALPGQYPQPQPPSVHSTPIFHARRTSAGPATNPSSQETSPSTPHSTYSQFGHSPPAVGPGLLQPPAAPLMKTPPFPTMDPLSRLPSVPGGPRYGEDPSYPPDVPPGLIPVTVDYKSGSRSQAEKRKANSDASRRFRNRKKQEQAMEQRIKSQEEEIRMLTEERDYYRAERDFYRETLSRTVGLGQLPARPPSPRQFRSSLNQQASESRQESWRAGEGTAGNAGSGAERDTTGQLVPQGIASAPQLAPVPPVAHGGWSSDAPSFAMPAPNVGRQSAPDDRQIRPQQPFPAPWTSGAATGNLNGGQLSQAQLTSTSAPQDPQPSGRTF